MLNCNLDANSAGIAAFRPDASGYQLLLGGREAAFGALRPTGGTGG